MAAGELHYFTGKPCKRGHVANRLVSSKVCVECQREKRLADPEKTRALSRKWYNLHAESERARAQEKNKRYRAEGRKWPQPAWKLRMWGAAFRDKNPEYHKEFSRRHYFENKHMYRSANRKRRAVLRSIGGEHHTAADIKRIASQQRNLCACCNMSIRRAFHADHIVPIALGGSNAAKNIQLLCPSCNLSKGAREPIVFMQSRGFLL